MFFIVFLLFFFRPSTAGTIMNLKKHNEKCLKQSVEHSNMCVNVRRETPNMSNPFKHYTSKVKKGGGGHDDSEEEGDESDIEENESAASLDWTMKRSVVCFKSHSGSQMAHEYMPVQHRRALHRPTCIHIPFM